MPESYNFYKGEIRQYFKHQVNTNKKILDVGPGIGTYSNLLRDLGYQMDSIEIWEPYVDEYNLKSKYDIVHIGNIIEFDISAYDFIILGDVLEHLSAKDAKELINKIDSSGKECLVAVPYEMEQGEYYGNVHESHLQSDLTPEVIKNRYPSLHELYSNNFYGYYTNKKLKLDKAYVLYASESYYQTVSACVRMLGTNVNIIVYMLNSDLQVKGAYKTIRWDCDIKDKDHQDSYIDRKDPNIYQILIERPAIVKDALLKYAEVVAYIDSDSVATKYADTIFDMYDNKSTHPYFTESIYEYMGIDGRFNIEDEACSLFGVPLTKRGKYRQTGYFVAGQYCFEFLSYWYAMCRHHMVINDHNKYAPYHEETIVNVLMWDMGITNSLPLVYSNAKLDKIDFINKTNQWGQEISEWFKLPKKREELLFLHGEKDIDKMVSMKLKKRILYIAPHLSTGGMPAFLLKTIQKLNGLFEIYVVEYQCYSLDFIVQRDAIKELVGDNFTTLFEDKNELFNVIDKFCPDIIHIHEPSERLDSYIMSKLYRPNRLYKIIETCHDVSFDPQTKLYHPDAYAFCTPYHYNTFAHLPSYKKVIEYPIDPKESKKLPGINNVVNVGLWTPGKNQAEGIEIARANPNFNFNFVGNQAGNFKDYWEPLMTDLPSNVKVWGERDDVDEFLKHANIFMFNSTWECSPLVLREAISYGLPIIAHNLPQYGSMFDKYIQPIDTELNTIKCNYIVPTDNTSDIFANKYNDFYNEVLMMPHESQDVHIYKYFIEQPFLEIKSVVNSDFKVQFIDENDICQYENTIQSNSWVKLNRQYFTPWRIKIFEFGELIYDYKLSLKGHRVFITITSSSLGDTIAWVPYVLEFKKKHECNIILSTFWNKLLDMPEVELVEPGTRVENIFAQYNIGWFYDSNREPVTPNTIKLQEAATNILGLEFKELKPKLKYENGNNKYGKYVTIATNSTSGCKFWTREGWQEVINFLHDNGYRVINVSKENNPFDNCEKIDDISIENTMSVIHHSKFFIGLSSGISWLAWALGKEVVMISNFTTRAHEFNCIRVVNENVCHGCWNEPGIKFDAANWEWCPKHENTPRQFECHRSISHIDVLEKLAFIKDL
jgi:autotransporter strand-loop-strand O-heptosyltransferase